MIVEIQTGKDLQCWMVHQIHIRKFTFKFLRKVNQTSLVLPMVLITFGLVANIALVIKFTIRTHIFFLTDINGSSYFPFKVVFLNQENTLPTLEKYKNFFYVFTNRETLLSISYIPSNPLSCIWF